MQFSLHITNSVTRSEFVMSGGGGGISNGILIVDSRDHVLPAAATAAMTTTPTTCIELGALPISSGCNTTQSVICQLLYMVIRRCPQIVSDSQK